METVSVHIVSRGADLSVLGSGFEEGEPFLDGIWEGAQEGGFERRLFTATLELDRCGLMVRAFHACHATSEAELLEGLARRLPTSFFAMVEVYDGIDAGNPIVARLVPSVTLHRLATIGDCCPNRRPLAGGGVLHIVEGMG